MIIAPDASPDPSWPLPGETTEQYQYRQLQNQPGGIRPGTPPDSLPARPQQYASNSIPISGAFSDIPLFPQLVSSYRNLGYSPTQAVNIASVQIRGEGANLGSGGADAAQGGSNGISQWSRDRWNRGVQWMTANGLDPRSVAGQTAFTDHELRTSYQNANPNSVASLVTNYESPRADLAPDEIARSQRFAAANYENPPQAMTLPPATQAQGTGPLAYSNPAGPLTLPVPGNPPLATDAGTPATPAAAATTSGSTFGDMLAGLAKTLTNPKPHTQAPVNPNVQVLPPPDLAALLYGTHPNLVLA